MNPSEKSLSYQDIQVNSPYAIQRLHELRIVKTVNDHATMYLTGLIPEDKAQTYIEKAKSTDSIEINQVDQGSKVRTLFNGKVSQIGMKVVRGVTYIEVEAVSHTIDLDLKRLRRTFQDTEMRYTSLIEEVIRAYPGSDFIDNAADSAKLGQFILQYDETDWQFLKRMASHVGTVLVPEAAAGKPKFWFGVPEGKQAQVLDFHFSSRKPLALYMETTGNDHASVGEDDFVSYELETSAYLNLGDTVMCQGKELVVARSTAVLEDGILNYRYLASPKAGIRQNRIHNHKLTGASLEGKVIEISKDTIKVHLDIDKEQNKSKACWFPYSTFYSAEGNSGWYCMPQLGDSVKLYLPSHREEEAIANSSVRKGGGSQPKTSDPGTKYIGTDKGKELKMAGKELMLSALASKQGNIFIKLNEDTGVEVHSLKPMVISSKKDIEMAADKRLTVKAREAIYLLCDASGIIMDGITDIQGTPIKMVGTEKAPVSVPDLGDEEE
ncbi:contractile injection system protein, VgrG/Pvc8 family [Brevibacillus dissolubilis]|uniref:contractile injection system protein, VgrG/Pvc8 family n=1 Tax=Brevibacillus dissolubilis TaxID=1844116 RepID=UPI001116D84B|nr:contractile injection system protein, VgrG/Pvc8 family [Brevibacillus dissolubilis]